jgi:hypothetical protein
MFEMGSGAGATYGASFVGRQLYASRVAPIIFTVEGLTAGTVTIERQMTPETAWETLDATNLVFATDGNKVAVWGACRLRAVGDSSVAGDDLHVFVAGDYITRPTA